VTSDPGLYPPRWASGSQAGFTNVHNIVNGFEGDRVDDPGSVYFGKHMRNGWKNLGLPWGYDFDPDLMWVEPNE
jgi:hypothetical protein